jgi:hypothetical protein
VRLVAIREGCRVASIETIHRVLLVDAQLTQTMDGYMKLEKAPNAPKAAKATAAQISETHLASVCR